MPLRSRRGIIILIIHFICMPFGAESLLIILFCQFILFAFLLGQSPRSECSRGGAHQAHHCSCAGRISGTGTTTCSKYCSAGYTSCTQNCRSSRKRYPIIPYDHSVSISIRVGVGVSIGICVCIGIGICIRVSICISVGIGIGICIRVRIGICICVCISIRITGLNCVCTLDFFPRILEIRGCSLEVDSIGKLRINF